MQTFLHGRDLIGDLDFSKEETARIGWLRGRVGGLAALAGRRYDREHAADQQHECDRSENENPDT